MPDTISTQDLTVTVLAIAAIWGWVKVWRLTRKPKTTKEES